MEVMIASRLHNFFDFAESKKDKVAFKRNVELSKNLTKEAMSIFKAKPIRIIGRPKLEEKRSVPFNDATTRRLTLKGL